MCLCLSMSVSIYAIYVYVFLCLSMSMLFMSMCDRSARLVNMAPLVANGEALHNVSMSIYVCVYLSYLCLCVSMSIYVYAIYVYVRQVIPAGEHGAAGGQRRGSPQWRDRALPTEEPG
jgi:hypothetical protein